MSMLRISQTIFTGLRSSSGSSSDGGGREVDLSCQRANDRRRHAEGGLEEAIFGTLVEIAHSRVAGQTMGERSRTYLRLSCESITNAKKNATRRRTSRSGVFTSVLILDQRYAASRVSITAPK